MLLYKMRKVPPRNQPAMKRMLPFLALLLHVSAACTPRVVTVLEDQGTPTAQPATLPADCITFEKAKYPDDAINAHAVYRTFLRSNDLESAFPHWKTAFELAPAADGRRAVQYTDGVRFYKDFYFKSTDPAEQEAHFQKIRSLYEQGRHCYPADGYLSGMYAFDLYYSFRHLSTDEEIYQLFKATIDQDGKRTGAFVLNPFTDILIRRFQAGEIPVGEARHYDRMIREILEYGLVSSQEVESFRIVESYAPARLEELETSEDFYPPAYYLARYFPDYEADSANCEVVQTVYSRLRWGKVSEDDPRMAALSAKLAGPCRVEEPLSTARTAFEALQAGRYREAVKGFEQAAEETEDNERKAGFYMLIAKVYYAHLKNFGQARTQALRAAKLKPNWGDPYLLIGKLYASSGPLCGPGRGWDSQVVTWVAIDKWQYARSIDPAAVDEANRLINQYSAFMPSTEDIFQRNLQEGSTYTVGCWIQETTRIRPAR